MFINKITLQFEYTYTVSIYKYLFIFDMNFLKDWITMCLMHDFYTEKSNILYNTFKRFILIKKFETFNCQ